MYTISNFSQTETIEAGMVKGYFAPERDAARDTDHGQSAIILDGVSPDGVGVHGSVRVILPSGVRVVDSLSVGVWVNVAS